MPRTKGTPNVITREVRDVLKGIIEGELKALPQRLAKLSDVDRIAVLMKMLPYVLPRVNGVSVGYGEPVPGLLEELEMNLD
jgi:hypothetical protein